ncbi:MAG: DUF4097 domain-containing protein [Lactobacillaceae bacterium]|jgi:DUF4097 and DUF4098 domain-containing protein YvlB|nr:DUF4097 domain-containing protein [Lactobacillaceae bacterium]
MPKMLKLILTGFVLVILGGIIGWIGYANHGMQDLRWYHNKFIVPHNEQVEAKLADFDNIKIDSTSLIVDVIASKSVQTPKIEGLINDNGEFSHSVHDRTLTVKYITDDKYIGIGFGSVKTGHIKIYVPANAKFNTINAGVGEGWLNLDGITANTIKADSQVGDVEFTNVHTNKLSVTTSMGYVKFNDVHAQTTNVHGGDFVVNVGDLGRTKVSIDDYGAFILTGVKLNNLVARVGDNSVNFTNVTMTGVNTLVAGDGDIKIDGLKVDGLSAQTDDGTINVGGQAYSDNFVQNETAPNRLSITSDDGSVTINNLKK